MSAFERFGSWCCDWIYTLERLAADEGSRVKEANGNALAGAVIKRKENVHASGPTLYYPLAHPGSACVSASSSGRPGYGQRPGICRPGTVWPVNPALFDT